MRMRRGLVKQSENVEDMSRQYPSLLPNIRAGMRSFVSVPLIARDEIIGVLHFRTVRRNAYDERDLRLAERIGAQIAGAMANAQLFGNLNKTEKSLRRSESQ